MCGDTIMWYWYLIAGIILLVVFFVIRSKKNTNHNDANDTQSPSSTTKKYQPRKLDKPKSYRDKFLYYDNFRDFKSFDRQDGFLFEDFVTRIFRRLGFRVIERTGQIQGEGNKNDHGIDIVFECTGIPILMQCKCYSNEVKIANVKEYSNWKPFAATLLNTNFQYVIVTNNYLEPFARKFLHDNNIYCIELDQLKALHSLSENADQDFSFAYEIKCNSCEYFTTDKFNNCNIGDELTFIVHKKSITIFNNELKQRGAENNNLAKLTVENDGLAKALTALYSYNQTSELECTIIEKDKDSLVLQIHLYKPVSEPLNDYSKLLDAIFPEHAA